MSKIVETHKDSSGEVQIVKLDDGRIMSKIDAASKAMSGELFLPDIIVAESKEGEPYLRSFPDGDKANNLENLPEISDYTGYEGGPSMQNLNVQGGFGEGGIQVTGAPQQSGSAVVEQPQQNNSAIGGQGQQNGSAMAGQNQQMPEKNQQ